MNSKLEEARQLLATRLDEVERERDQLIAAIAQLDGVADSKPAAPKRGSALRPRTRRRSGGKRAPRGQREQQLLSSITNHPDFRVADHAREVGVKPQQLYPILNRLAEHGKITKKDEKYVLA